MISVISGPFAIENHPGSAGNIPAAVEALGSAAARFVLAPSNAEREMQATRGRWDAGTGPPAGSACPLGETESC